MTTTARGRVNPHRLEAKLKLFFTHVANLRAFACTKQKNPRTVDITTAPPPLGTTTTINNNNTTATLRGHDITIAPCRTMTKPPPPPVTAAQTGETDRDRDPHAGTTIMVAAEEEDHPAGPRPPL